MKLPPDWLNSLDAENSAPAANLVIGGRPAFPVANHRLDGYGANLELVQHHQWGVWSGNASSQRRSGNL